MAENRTTIWVSHDLWKELNSRKEPGDSFEDVIQELIEKADDES